MISRLFGENLKRQRKLAGLTQDELAVMASVHRTEISQLERGLRVCRIDTLIKLASCLEISPEKLLEGISWRPGEVAIGRFRMTEDEPESS